MRWSDGGDARKAGRHSGAFKLERTFFGAALHSWFVPLHRGKAAVGEIEGPRPMLEVLCRVPLTHGSALALSFPPGRQTDRRRGERAAAASAAQDARHGLSVN